MKLVCSLIASILVVAGGACAEPVYLECNTKSAGYDDENFSVKIEESSGKITHTKSNGEAFNTEGFFQLNEITYQKITINGSTKDTDLFNINRTDLSVTFTSTIKVPEYPELPTSTWVFRGQCVMPAKGNRKF